VENRLVETTAVQTLLIFDKSGYFCMQELHQMYYSKQFRVEASSSAICVTS